MQAASRTVHPWLIVGVLSTSGIAAAMPYSLVLTVLPEVPGALGVSLTDASWIVTATTLASAVLTPILSRMADMYGKRRILVGALLTLAVGGLIAGLWASFWPVVVARALQGAGAVLVPVGISLMRDVLPARRMGFAIALMSATVGIGAAVGLPLSGVLFEAFGWASIFLSTALLGAVLAALVRLVVPESPVRTGGAFDIAGGVLLSVVLLAALLAVTKAAEWPPMVLLGLAGGAAALFVVWVLFELRVGIPLVDIRTAVRRPVLMTNIASFFIAAAMLANMLVMTVELQAPLETGYGFGLSATQAGGAMLPQALAMVVVAPASGALLTRFGGRFVLVLGGVVIAAGFVMRVLVGASLPLLIVGGTIVSVGIALAFAAMPALILAAVPITSTASANGVNALVRSLGISTCSALVAFVTSSLSADLGNMVVPTYAALVICLVGAAAFALAGAGIAMFIPSAVLQAPSSVRLVVHGRIRCATSEPVDVPAVVTFLTPEGASADWARASAEGDFVAALPGPGSYIAVVNAQGWAPSTHVVDVAADVPVELLVTERLTVGGRVRFASGPPDAALVVLHSAGGEVIGTTRTDPDGRYAFPRPEPGLYLVTAFGDGQAVTEKVQVGIPSAVVDLAAPEIARESTRNTLGMLDRSRPAAGDADSLSGGPDERQAST